MSFSGKKKQKIIDDFPLLLNFSLLLLILLLLLLFLVKIGENQCHGDRNLFMNVPTFMHFYVFIDVVQMAIVVNFLVFLFVFAFAFLFVFVFVVFFIIFTANLFIFFFYSKNKKKSCNYFFLSQKPLFLLEKKNKKTKIFIKFD